MYIYVYICIVCSNLSHFSSNDVKIVWLKCTAEP